MDRNSQRYSQQTNFDEDLNNMGSQRQVIPIQSNINNSQPQPFQSQQPIQPGQHVWVNGQEFVLMTAPSTGTQPVFGQPQMVGQQPLQQQVMIQQQQQQQQQPIMIQTIGVQQGPNITGVTVDNTAVKPLPELFSDACCKLCCKNSCIYISFIIFFAILALIDPTGVLGLLLLAVLPATLIMFFFYNSFKKSVTRGQMFITFGEAICWMLPLTIFLLLLMIFFKPDFWADCKQAEENSESDDPVDDDSLDDNVGASAPCIGYYAYNAYLVAGLLEESVKYCAIRRIVNKKYVVDPRALVVYSCCAGAGFAAVENILYVISGGVGTGIMRALVSVPLHCTTGTFMGVSLGEGRFLQEKTPPFWKVLILPVLVHGTYDFALFTTGGVDSRYMAVALLACIFLLSVSISYVYHRVRDFSIHYGREENVHELIRQGVVPKPTLCCGCVCDI